MRCVVLCAALVALPGSAPAQPDFEQFFPRRSYAGKAATSYSWSPSDRYLAYRWNKVDEPGLDLWLYDTKDGKAKRLTEPETFKPFDRDIAKALLKFKEREERTEKSLKMTEDEYREYLQEQRKLDEARKEPDPQYSGPSDFEWAKKADEMLMIYKGDIYRMKPNDVKPTRLTWTRDTESDVRYLPDDSGFTYRRGEGVYRMKFGSSDVRQLNPALPNGLPFGGYSISPDGTKLMITSSKSTGTDRQVDWIQYRERFAKAQKTTRGVADDKFLNESYVFLYDLKDELDGNDLTEQKPWEVYKYPGGEEFWEVSTNREPWSADSKKFTWATWKRDQKVLDLYVADLTTKKSKVIYSTKADGEHGSPGMADPFFTPDGKKIVFLSETSGYRHVWMADPLQEGAVQISKGDFESYPLAMSKDGKSVFVRSGKEDFARYQIYKVDVESGQYTRITRDTGMYGVPELSHDQSKAALTFANWKSPSETYLLDMDGGQKQITNSHRYDQFKKMNIAQPELFTYPNRNGQTIHGYIFRPDGWKKEDKRPLMIYVYGGPLGMGKSVDDGSFNSTAYWFNLYLTKALGFVTVTIDPRGQSGYGAVFGKANWEQAGKAQTEDLSDGVKYLIENAGVDPKRVALNGWSFGGFQTQMCMYSAPDVFTLGIAGAGPTEWQNYNTWYTGGVIGNSRDGKPEDLDKYSLTYLAKNLKNPLLLLHGIEDTNVLFQDTIHVYRKLLQYGKGHLVELSLDPTGGHGMGGDMNNRDRHKIYLEFIKKWWRL